MTCPCCVRYCHAPSPCQKDIRIKVTWGPVECLSTIVAANLGLCFAPSGSFSGVGFSEVTLGRCNDKPGVPNFPVTARIQIGGSQNAFQAYAFGSCCGRTGQRTARIYGGKVACIVRNGPQINFERSVTYNFSFASLDAAAAISEWDRVVVGDTTACGQALLGNLIDTPPQVELVIAGNPPDFCDPRPIVNDFPAVSGPYGSSALCADACGNPLP